MMAHNRLRILVFLGAMWIFTLPSKLYSQIAATKNCGFSSRMQYWEKHASQDFLRTRYQQEEAYRAFIENSTLNVSVNSRASCHVFRIPVVVHVFYDDASSNISVAQIQSQIDVLNQDFRRLRGTPGFGEGVDTHIEFCLATKAPDGSATNGITRTGSTFTNHKSSEERLLKNQTNWDDSKYLNIWVVKSVTWINPDNPGQNEEILGYASLPRGPGNIPRGVVISNKSFGTTGTVGEPYNMGRTCTHEVGHFLGLYHPYEEDSTCRGDNLSNCLSQGDFVCDTPAEQYPTFGCPDQALNSCEDRPCDSNDPISNYMNLTDDICMDHFTEGQRLRMEFFLNSTHAQLHSPANLVATGCDQQKLINSVPIARFSANQTSSCPDNPIQFMDESIGCVENRVWFFEGGLPLTSTDANPVISYTSPGNYEVRLTVSNAAGADSMIKKRWIHIPEPPKQTPLYESFEGIGFIPEDWFVADEDLQGSWVRTQLAAVGGQSSAVALHRNLGSCNSHEDLLTHMIDLSNANSARLFFSYAYQAANNDAFDADNLSVEVSTDCGENYASLFEAAGSALATVPQQQNAFPFIPRNPIDWKSIQIDLANYVGESQLMIRFRTLGLNGQNLFLDDILLDANVGIDPEQFGLSYLRIAPNPFKEKLGIHFGLKKTQRLKVEIRDVQGKRIYTGQASLFSAGDHSISLEKEYIGILPCGVYLLRIITTQGVFNTKIVKHI